MSPKKKRRNKAQERQKKAAKRDPYDSDGRSNELLLGSTNTDPYPKI